MYFKKLELIGFKSFAEKTTLHFEPGITAVVGPNGCGKSNIFDAIRWVLGEQSIKELRGSDSQDVIFNGSDTKEQLSMAEVSLAFDNSSKFFPVDYSEVLITRRIFRSGESEYLLNKTQVRLKDILDILLGTGIGAESYSLIQQGKIDLVLSSRPEDRRLVFDEASGITKYKSQKREALRKLEETEQNLLRVNDIITEVKRQIGSLERQANKARRYKEVFEELKLKELNLAIHQKNNLNCLKDGLIKGLRDLELKESELLNTISEQEAKISSRQSELKELENNINSIKDEIVNLENSLSRSVERISFNRERITELDSHKKYLQTQAEQTKSRLTLDEEKLNHLKDEHTTIQKNITEKTALVKEGEGQLNALNQGIKAALENITQAKKSILDLVTRGSSVKNDLGDATAKQQIHLARQKRLEIEKAKVREEKSVAEDNLNKLKQELGSLEKTSAELKSKILDYKKELETEGQSLNNINLEIQNLEKQSLSLLSHKDFLEKLKSEYEGIGEAMNALIYLDKVPAQKLSGLVIKIKGCANLTDEDKAYFDPANFKLSGEAKPIDLNTDKIMEKINQIQGKIDSLKVSKNVKESRIAELHKDIANAEQNLRAQETVLIDKQASHKNILEQFNKIKEEEDIITLELSDVEKELSAISEKITHFRVELTRLENEQKEAEDLIFKEQNSISSNNHLKEQAIVIITQTKTELEALIKRTSSEEATLKILEDTYQQDKENFFNLEGQIKDNESKRQSLESEIKDLEEKTVQTKQDIQNKNQALKESQNQYQAAAEASSGIIENIELQKKDLDGLKNKLYELQMQDKELDFKYLSIKERILQAYKVDLDTVLETQEGLDEAIVTGEIQRLKEKLDAYGTVNLVAIEEYDELKKRYDFLTQQQNDLNSAKESLHHAILKINRTTKQMFVETFEKVKLEFRNYFKLLFNGGDAQLFLIDEQDPLESGIEIICRPPGKKLQNVLLLSGGEKALSAIALIFAIFKVKPAPFCVLDEIDAALDEANVDRYSRLLHEFAKDSQFIVITHNKRTIVNADIMYGITMQESGVSKIVSVKFAKDEPVKDKEPDVSPVAEPV